jgi:hypothetical protein
MQASGRRIPRYTRCCPLGQPTVTLHMPANIYYVKNILQINKKLIDFIKILVLKNYWLLVSWLLNRQFMPQVSKIVNYKGCLQPLILIFSFASEK